MKNGFKSLLRIVLGFSSAINLLWLVPAIFSLQVFDRVLSSHSKETLLVLCLGVAIALVLVGALEYLRGRLQGILGNIVNDALSPMMAKLTLMHGAQRMGPLHTETLRDVARLRALFSTQGLLAVLDAPWAVIFLGVIWMAHPWLGIAATVCAIFMVMLAVLNDRMTRESIKELQLESGRTQRYLDQTMNNAEVAQALGMGDALVARWRQLSAKVAQLQGPTATRSVAMSTVSRIFRQLLQIIMTTVGAYLVITGESTAGVMIASSMLLGRALAPIEQIVGGWKILAEGRLAFQRLKPLIEEAQNAPPQMALPAPSGKLTAQGLVFRIPRSERMILAGVSLSLNPGESLAIVGPSGAGKSTLLRLLLGLWVPASGSVRLDNVELVQWGREEVGPYIGYVPQDVELFAGTIADNIARMALMSDPNAIVMAARLARVHELILSLPDGYDTRIDPHSALLSPGQRQRIALARALFGNPRLLILDEPNSNLDGAGEAALAEILKELKGKCTVVVVTHRPALTQHVDKMLVLEGGRATHYGTAAEVKLALQMGVQPGKGMTQVVQVAPATPTGQPTPAAQETPVPQAAQKAPVTQAAPHVVAPAQSTARPTAQPAEVVQAAQPAKAQPERKAEMAPPQEPQTRKAPPAEPRQSTAADAGRTRRRSEAVPSARPIKISAFSDLPVPARASGDGMVPLAMPASNSSMMVSSAKRRVN